MGRELSHGDVKDLLGVYALDAVDGEEREAVEQHLDHCPACRAEVADHREVAAFMAAGWMPAPEGVWDRIAGALEETPPSMGLGSVVPLGAARERRRERRMGPFRVAAAVGVAAVLAVTGFLGAKVVDTSDKVNRVDAALQAADLERVAEAAARRDDARPVSLRSSDGRLSADAVLLSDGSGYLVRSNLPELPSDRSYQLWAVMGTAKISVGVLGPSAGPVAFRAAGDVSALAITEEVAGGVIVSQKEPTVLGTVA